MYNLGPETWDNVQIIRYIAKKDKTIADYDDDIHKAKQQLESLNTRREAHVGERLRAWEELCKRVRADG